MRNERTLDLGCSQAMSGNIDHVVDTTHDPEVAVLVLARAVTGKVHALNLRPVLLLITRVVAIDGPQHGRPGLGDDEVAARVRAYRVTITRHHVSLDAGKWLSA